MIHDRKDSDRINSLSRAHRRRGSHHYFLKRINRRKLPDVEAVDPIDRRTNLPMVEPIKRDWAEIKERGQLVVLAPYNSTSYFLCRGEPLGYEYELLGEFAKEHGVDRKSFYALPNGGDGDIVAARLIPTEEDKANISFTRELYRTEPALVQQALPPDKANLPEAAEKALQPGPADELPEMDSKGAAHHTKPSQLAGETVTLAEKSAYHRTLVELADNISGDINVVETSGEIGDEALAQKAGHVEDAQRLTEKYGGNPVGWDDVSYRLLQKSKQQYSADPVVKFGFCRGNEPVNYVNLILERFDHYKQFVVN